MMNQRSQSTAHSRSASGLQQTAKDQRYLPGAERRADQSRRELRRSSGNWPRGVSSSPSANATNLNTELSPGPQHDLGIYLEFRDNDEREALDFEKKKRTDNEIANRQRRSQLLSNINKSTSPLKFSKTSPVIRSESLRSLHANKEPQDGGTLASFRRRPLARSTAGFQSLTSVELRSERNSKESEDKRRNAENASVQTDTPETDTRHSYAQTEYVTDSVTTTGSDVTDSHPNLDESYELGKVEYDHRMSHGEEEEEEDTSVNRSFDHCGRKVASDFDKQGSSPRRDDGRGESSTFSEFDSGVGNMLTRDHATYMRRTRYKESARTHEDSCGMHSGQEASVGSFDARLSQASTRVLIGVKPELVPKTVPLGNWVLLDAGAAGFCVEPWISLGVNGDRENAARRDFATQTFGQAMDSFGHSEEIQNDGSSSKQTEERSGKVFNHSTEVEENRRINQPHQTEDKEKREARNEKKDDFYADALTDEIIRVFKDTRQLITEAAAEQKMPKEEHNSGTSELLKIMIREVKNLKDRVKPAGPVENNSGKTLECRNAGFWRKSAGYDSVIDTEEEEEKKRETGGSRRRENLNRHEPGPKRKSETRSKERNNHDTKRATRGSVDRWRAYNTKENVDHFPETIRPRDPLRPNIPTENLSRYLPSDHPSRNARASVPRGPNVPRHARHRRQQDLGSAQNSGDFPNVDQQRGPYPRYSTQATYPTNLPEQPLIQNRFHSGGNINLQPPLYQYSGHEHMLPQNGNSHIVGLPVQNGSRQPVQTAAVPSHQSNVVFVPTTQNPSTNPQQSVYPGQIHPAPYGQTTYVPVQLLHQSRFVDPGQPHPTVPRRNKDPAPVLRPNRNRPSKQWKVEALDFEMSVAEAFQKAKKMKALSNQLLKQLDFAV